MDNCDLQHLRITPAKLKPTFQPNITKYESTVTSDVDKVKFDCLTSDSGASYYVVGSNEDKLVELMEDKVNDICIEVTAEDGSIKKYFVRIKRLSAKDASLQKLSLSNGNLQPSFASDIVEYNVVASATLGEIVVDVIAADKKCKVTIDDVATTSSKIQLNFGETSIKVSVTSVDLSNTLDYLVIIRRNQFPWPIFIKDQSLSSKFQCPVSLSPIFCPINLNSTTFISQPCIELLIRRLKMNPFDGSPLKDNWNVIDVDADKKVSGLLGVSPYLDKGITDDTKISEIAPSIKSRIEKFTLHLQSEDITESEWFKSSSSKPFHPDHLVEVRNWEKRLEHMSTGESHDLLLTNIENLIKSYKSKLPKSFGIDLFEEKENSIKEDLKEISIKYAACIKNKSRDSMFHMKLGYSLEEQDFLKELFQIDLEKNSNSLIDTNEEAKESSKLEECFAICSLRGIAHNHPIAEQLKAIDAEYKDLLRSGKSSQADHVQGLYNWRSKSVKKEGEIIWKIKNEALVQANLKYKDALKTDSKNFVANFHVARFKIKECSYTEAVKILQTALRIEPLNIEARFLYGYALMMRDDATKSEQDEAIKYLHQGFNHWLLRRFTDVDLNGMVTSSSTDFYCEDFWRLTNLLVYESFFILAENLSKNPRKDYPSAKYVLHTIALNASMALSSMYTNKSNLYKQIEWILLSSHHELLKLINEPQLIIQRSKYISALIRCSVSSNDSKLLNLQEQIAQKLVSLNPCDSEALYLLGCAQFSIYQYSITSNYPKIYLLDEAITCFTESIRLEGKLAEGEVPKAITEQKWWKNKTKTAENTKMQTPTKDIKSNKMKTSNVKITPNKRGVNRNAIRGRAPNRTTRSSLPPPKSLSSDTANKDSLKKSNPPVVEDKDKKIETPIKPKQTKTNLKSHLTRLELARALSKTDDRKNEAKDKYEEVIALCPQNHDAYIELAEILVSSDPLAAVDVFSKFPTSENESFDDAYINGEVVGILMKHKKFEDPRLAEYMIRWGQIMGFGILEKHVKTLEENYKNDLLRSVYCGINRRKEDDPEVIQFFKFKCWI